GFFLMGRNVLDAFLALLGALDLVLLAVGERGAMLHVLRALHCLRALRLLRVDLRPMLPQRLERNLWQPMATFCCLLFVSCAFVCFFVPFFAFVFSQEEILFIWPR
ncbi:unnamed protein product, partial [Effrenium voratum]